MKRRTILAAPALLLPLAAHAQGSYPDRPIRFVIPWTPGGTNDIVGRVVSDAMSRRFGQAMVIENRGGAGGALGAEVVAKTPPDGYTVLLSGSGSLVINQLVRRGQLPYDPTTALTAVGMMGLAPNVLVVHPSVRASTMQELQALARAARAPLTYGSSGVGSTSHATGAMIAQALGVEMQHVPYRGSAPAVNDVIAGRLDMMANAAAPMLPHIRAGTVRAIAIAGHDRAPTTPEVPTTAEQGFPQVEADTWYAMHTTGGTPPDRIARLHAVLNESLAEPDVRRVLMDVGLNIAPSESPAAFGRFVEEDTRRWEPVIRAVGVTTD